MLVIDEGPASFLGFPATKLVFAVAVAAAGSDTEHELCDVCLYSFQGEELRSNDR